MKLNTTELVMEIEDVFSVKIPQEEARRFATAGDIFHYIFTLTSAPKNLSVCLFAITFFTIRKAATALNSRNDRSGNVRSKEHLSKKLLLPSNPTSAILPDSSRRKFWLDLKKESKLTLPPLRRPGWLVTACTVAVIACSVVIGVLVSQKINSPMNGVLVTIAIGLELALIASLMTRPFAVLPDAKCDTLRGLTDSTLAMNRKSLSDRYNVTNKDDLWIALCTMIAEQHGISLEEIDPAGKLLDKVECD